MSAKSFIGSILVSIIIIGLAGYFGLPYIYPGLNDVDDENILIQSEFMEYQTEAYIYDNMLNYAKMSDTELNITIQSNSKIAAIFSASSLLVVGQDFDIGVFYEISLVIKGTSWEGNRTTKISYYDDTGPLLAAQFREFTESIYLYYETESLPAGTYTISMYWRSIWDAAGTLNILSVNNLPNFNYSRSLLAQEFKST